MWAYFLSLLSGIYITLILMVATTSLGLLLAVVMTAISYFQQIFLKKIVDILIFLICGTPLLVQIFLIYYGSGQFEWIRQSILWPILSQPMYCSIIALALNTACYTTVIFTAAIQSIPQNEIAATLAMGMSPSLSFRRIILPRAFQIALPAYSNEITIILKSTSLASTITIMDIMGITQKMIAQTYQTLEWYLLAAVIYLVLNSILSYILSVLARNSSKSNSSESS